MRRPSRPGIQPGGYTGAVRPRWHSAVITLALVGIAAWGVFALWGQTIETWIDGAPAVEQRGPDRLPGIRRAPL